MDIDGLRDVLHGIADGRIRCIAVDTPVPSQFSHEILNANPYAYLDDAPLEERRARAVEMRRVLPESVLQEVGRLDPAAIAEVRQEAWPDVRDADELHDVLQTFIALPAKLKNMAQAESLESQPEDGWAAHFSRLVAERRAGRAVVDGTVLWVTTEKAVTFSAIYPEAKFESELPQIASSNAALNHEDAILTMVTGWM